ncbi:sugar ABC transporter substrate-binding protein [uncultured Thiothrix sp.]|jgi:ribose transport system substrate-binding protein|uniref:sugar ABC transporter substrate-binding protein n=1 Tax=uncultured Thiothrix sp. TaxID=223185 RepID=UPI0026144E8E|nr:sugar ABC transporter substrate-binding protein [uncultured Thiothrix sp.]HMT91544.1 sugar ABC transporter substrate-binding protein [Thiolinea sp.]
MTISRRQFAFTMLASLGLMSSIWTNPVFAEDAPKVALIMKSLANEFFQSMEEGAKAHQKENAAQYSLVTNGIKDETDTAAQIKILEQMVAQKVNAIMIAPADSKALVPAIKAAVDKGVLVVNIDNQLDQDALKDKGLVVPFVGPDNRAGAKLVGDYVAKQLKEGDKVAIIEGVSTTFNAQQRTAGYKDAMEAAKITVVGVQSGNWEIDGGNKVTSAFLRENPDLKAVLAGNDSMAIGAVAAIKAAGKVGTVLVGGYDNISAVKPLLTDGSLLATADQFGSKQAVFGIEVALKAIADKQSQNDMQAQVKTDVVLVTKDSK